jgi:hypothetical protein
MLERSMALETMSIEAGNLTKIVIVDTLKIALVVATSLTAMWDEEALETMSIEAGDLTKIVIVETLKITLVVATRTTK